MIWTIVSALFILTGIIGAVAPFLPGAPLVLGGLLLYGYTTDWVGFSGWAIGIFAGLTIFTLVIDVFGPALGARGLRASRLASIGAFIGVILGVALFGPLGIVIGPLLGAFAGEYYSSRNPQLAAQAARSTFIAFVVGTAVKLGIVFAMAGYFIQHLPEYPAACCGDEWLNIAFLRGAIPRQEGAGFIDPGRTGSWYLTVSRFVNKAI
ncbi:MAG: hypothetical protein A3A83_04065 [Candidatus Doudnabacteria bacterium RIFCSPLOWO2_01_FULL_48_57]|uniref:DUF456 domain-containing protein n=1 Tax=Candidatus Doudnabacteria bacterium RIFCSPLOWO2_02_FULL_48_13 TaxID=1817845 RepID=A0A1F5QBD9_9BACT|nr:MAG: hypothetical protein A3K05_01760 [Candidatus Doudnabacteria bacterium RIFCSPHIGHO2_01_48_18]OGE77307.1 MAG: hypothetical protein A2668_02670 [Candidatus Doudnabacteria bacterium RIFCSPHIGHO2_01_FULL_48_180]OGE96878.1 MAG: hypothetical protein A3A83_04065 [Candidatus Doudnabacteria bacterium RIFCSPLOWO2_01_FULL_48_57]OGE99437.1 MAG: hypothetical protein A3J05_03795 [Candidatus Doudnabacteria bacterium RIFCSPLOWO2_02_FULL_48_13]OGF00463.1 MAG: hypothetical protein A3G07_04045 [Candidatus 